MLDVETGIISHTAKLKIELNVGASKLDHDRSDYVSRFNAPTITITAAGPSSIQGLPVKIN